MLAAPHSSPDCPLLLPTQHADPGPPLPLPLPSLLLPAQVQQVLVDGQVHTLYLRSDGTCFGRTRTKARPDTAPAPPSLPLPATATSRAMPLAGASAAANAAAEQQGGPAFHPGAHLAADGRGAGAEGQGQAASSLQGDAQSLWLKQGLESMVWHAFMGRGAQAGPVPAHTQGGALAHGGGGMGQHSLLFDAAKVPGGPGLQARRLQQQAAMQQHQQQLLEQQLRAQQEAGAGAGERVSGEGAGGSPVLRASMSQMWRSQGREPEGYAEAGAQSAWDMHTQHTQQRQLLQVPQEDEQRLQQRFRHAQAKSLSARPALK